MYQLAWAFRFMRPPRAPLKPSNNYRYRTHRAWPTGASFSGPMEDQWTELHPLSDYKHCDREQVLQIIRNAGIAGMGGAGFPTDIKLRPRGDRKVETLILNGAECEPYITADDLTMREHAAEVVSGMQVMAWILRPARCVIGIEDNKPEAIAAMRAAVQGTRIEIAVIPTKYPSGGDKQLIRILTGLEVPSDGIPADRKSVV